MIRDNDFINGFDIERILGDLPIDIIKENIKSQIDDPLTFMTNHYLLSSYYLSFILCYSFISSK